MNGERWVEVFPLGDGRWCHRIVEDGIPGPSSVAMPSALDAARAAVHLYPEDEIRIEERHG